MTFSKTNSTPLWRDFEKLVARIEQVLAGSGIKVISPDRIPSLLTGRRREVDASLRTKIGSAEVLVTIECRKRHARQDVTWIEQLGSKKQALGAARTIAVASSAFSDDAVRVARHYGIDLRVLSEISEADMRNWVLLPRFVVHVFKQWDLPESPHIIFMPEEGDDVLASAPKIVGSPTAESLIFIGADGGPASLADLWLRADDQLKIFEGVPVDDKCHLRRLRLEPSDTVKIHTEMGLRRVHSIYMTVSLRWKHERIPLGAANVVAYLPADPVDQMKTQVRAEFEFKEATTSNIRFGMQFHPSEDDATFTLELTPGKKA